MIALLSVLRVAMPSLVLGQLLDAGAVEAVHPARIHREEADEPVPLHLGEDGSEGLTHDDALVALSRLAYSAEVDLSEPSQLGCVCGERRTMEEPATFSLRE